MTIKSTLTKIALSAALIAPALASAELVTFDFGTGGVFTGGTSNNSFGNSVVFTGSDGSTTVTVSAFAMTQGTTGLLNLGAPYAITSAAVTRNGNGLGVCNRAEFGFGGISNTCASLGAGGADNLGFDEFLLFRFSKPLDVQSIGLTPVANNPVAAAADSDLAIWSFAGPIAPLGDLFTNLPIGPKTVLAGNPGPNALPRTANDLPTNAQQLPDYIMTADPTDVGRLEDDVFRISGLTAQIPLPGTLALLGVAALAAGAASRKRQTA